MRSQFAGSLSHERFEQVALFTSECFRYSIGCMAGGIYPRGKVFWVWWTEKVKGSDGKVRSKRFAMSSQSDRRADAKTLLATKMYEATKHRPRLAEKLTYEEI